MRYLPYFFLLLIIPTLFSGCARKQLNQLNKHRDLLAQAANSTTMTPEEKMDVMMGSYTSMMAQALKIVNPKKGGDYVSKYVKDNKESINKILDDMGNWQKSLGPVQKAALAVRMTQKPYAKDAIDLIPKFRRKYKQIKLALKLTKGITSKLFGLGKLIGN